MQTIEAIYQKFNSSLSEIYEAGERDKITMMAFEDVMHLRRIDIALRKKEELNLETEHTFENILSELMAGKPIQYVLGHAHFCGLNLIVNENVLIPRPETEELVSWIISDIRESFIKPELILDVCTGSGCISLALKKEFPKIKVVAVDVSNEAIGVARENAITNKLEIIFSQADALDLNLDIRPDIIVSNPPYVTMNERDSMQKRITDFEPEIALFVPDSDALKFYKAISAWAGLSLKKKGKIYFEINEKKGTEVEQVLTYCGFENVIIRKDLLNKDRMIRGIKNV